MKLATITIMAVLALSCAEPSDPCNHWIELNMCFVGAAVCDNGTPKVACIYDKDLARKYANADPDTVRRAVNLEIGTVFEAPDYCWPCGELERKGSVK